MLGRALSHISLKKICTELMPRIEFAHRGLTIPTSLTEYQGLILNNPLFRDLFLHEMEITRALLITQHLYGSWLQLGMPIFRITSALASSLLLTDPSNVEPELVHPPFTTFALSLPEDLFESSFHGRPSPLTFAFVHHLKTIKDRLSASSFKEALDMPHIDLLKLMLCGPKVMLHDAMPPPHLHGDLPTWLNGAEKHSSFGKLDLERDEADKNINLAFRRLYINLCLYIAERGRGQREVLPQTKKRKRRQAKATPEPATWILGKEVHLDKELVSSARAWVRSHEGDKGRWKIKRRSITRGHWRNQPCGPSRIQRKRIWIEPFWRGPEAGTKVQHIYTTTKEEGSNGTTTRIQKTNRRRKTRRARRKSRKR